MSRKLILTVALLFALAGSQEVNEDRTEAARDDASQFIVAILRADGTLVPFAQYGNGGWMNPWPKPRQSAESIYTESTEEIPHSLGDLPEPWFKQCGKIPKRWYFWSSAGTRTVLNADKVVQVENHSQNNWALTTDFPKQNTDNTHHRNLGIAATADQKIEPLIEIRFDAAEAKELTSFVRQAFKKAETAELKTLYRSKSRLDGEYLYYFEAEQKVSANRDCPDISLFQGWTTADELGGMGMLDSRQFLTDCDLKGPSFMTPLGLLRLQKSTYLFVAEHGWEDESYLILDLNTSGLHKVLETFGG